MEACILRFNRRRRRRSLVLPFVDVACFLVGNEGCNTVLCVAAWATRVALLRANRLFCIESLEP